ncbi:MAG: hypothetical protein CM15mP63_4600 [Gammaproteobacteria bacterium]|nr:MAG: hypothetical protein CM15mP63_4600 [Gammaproteobacteria bacterium]
MFSWIKFFDLNNMSITNIYTTNGNVDRYRSFTNGRLVN